MTPDRSRQSGAPALLLVLWLCGPAALPAQAADCPTAPASALQAAPGPAVGGLESIARDYERRLQKIARRGEAPGVALALIESGRLSWLSSRGLTRRRGDQPFTPETVLPLGRLSEIPIALQAVRAGRKQRLDLDAPIAPKPPPLRDSPWPMPSVVQLLGHQGGLNGGRLHDLYVNQDDPQPGPTPIYPIRAPGLLESYSLVGYQLVYAQLERMLGSDLRAQIVADLASLRAPRCAESAFRYRIAADEARGHLDRETLDPLAASDPGALGLRSNLQGLIDLVAPLTRLKTGAAEDPIGVFTRADFAALVQPTAGGKLDFGRRGGLGFALARSQREGVGLVALAFGLPPGYRIEIRVALDHDIATILVANGGDEDDLDEIGSDLLDDVLTARKGLPARERDPPLPDFVALPEEVSPAPWAQRYATPIGRLKIERLSGDGFDFEIFGRGFRATEREDGWYQISYRLLGVIPLRFSVLRKTLLHSASWEGQSLLLAHIYGRTLLIGSAVGGEPSAEWTDDWLGEYRLSNPDLLSELLEVETIRIGSEERHLYIEYQLPFFLDLKPRVLLEAVDRSQLKVSGIGPLLGERLGLSESGGRKRLEYAGYSFERISPE